MEAGRNPSLPGTTKRRITTNLKSINNQKCQKIKLHENPTTKELKKQSTRTTRLVRTISEAAHCMGQAGGEKPWEAVHLQGHVGRLREPPGAAADMRAGLAEGETETQS